VKVAVLKGGSSEERSVSLRSGARVEDALGRLGHEVAPIDVGPGFVELLREDRPDVAFIALHGRDGEDGTVQELLEILGIPYTGPGVAACVRCMDKVLAKHALRAAGVPTPDWVSFNETAFLRLGAIDALENIEERLGFPFVVKPSRQGSALGVTFASDRGDVAKAIMSALSYDDQVLLERHVSGRELAISVVGDEPLPVLEVIPKQEHHYDFAARYDIGSTEFSCPADLDPETAASATGVAMSAYRVLGCEGFSRVDVMLGEDGPEVLEVNAIPGMTETSLLPLAVEASGRTFEEFLDQLIDLALQRGPSSATLSG